MDTRKVYNELKTNEQIVKDILEKYPNTRDDDFILYAWVLYYNKIPLNQTLRNFLGTARQQGAPAFASITKIRRTLQGIYPHLKGTKAKARKETQMAYRVYNYENN